VPTDPGIRVYGWADAGTELSTSKHSTAPMSYNVDPNTLQLDQFILRIEKQPDTVQTDHFDWGFRLSNLYGIDYRFTTQQGILSNQLLQRNQLYGYDPVEAYGILYFPKVAQGLELQIGRYISPPDIEAQLAPNNYIYSHSLMFTYDAYTQTGVLGILKLSNYWTIEAGLHGGNDTSPWNPSAHLTGELFGRWISHSNHDSVLFGVDAYNNAPVSVYDVNGEAFAHDNVQQFNATWTHVFNPRLHVLTEGYYIYSKDAFLGGTINNGPYQFGSGGGDGPFSSIYTPVSQGGYYIPGISSSVGLVNYIEDKISPDDFISLRTDYLTDPNGQRTGFRSNYGSLTFGITHKFNSKVEIRPEYRIEHAFGNGATPYDNATKSYQRSFGMDAIINFGNP
jgi:hypothetical protein